MPEARPDSAATLRPRARYLLRRAAWILPRPVARDGFSRLPAGAGRDARPAASAAMRVACSSVIVVGPFILVLVGVIVGWRGRCLMIGGGWLRPGDGHLGVEGGTRNKPGE